MGAGVREQGINPAPMPEQAAGGCGGGGSTISVGPFQIYGSGAPIITEAYNAYFKRAVVV
jgi:hypothetical protein